MFKQNYKKNRGFTLVEIFFGISIFLIILFVLVLLSKNIWTYNSFITLSIDGTGKERQALKTITSEMRTASSANNGAYAVNQASSTSFTFYSDIYDNGIKERVRYFLNGSQLQKGVVVPSGSPLTYNIANETITTIISNLTNSTVFDYYSNTYDGTTGPLSSPVDIAAIRLVKVTLTIDKNTTMPPPATTFSTQITLRNLKDNL